jgi:hypothetical protein
VHGCCGVCDLLRHGFPPVRGCSQGTAPSPPGRG